MVLFDVDMAIRRLAKRAHAEDHAVVFPARLVDMDDGHMRCRARQPRLEAAHRLFAAEAMRNRNDQRAGHLSPPSSPINVVPTVRSERAAIWRCEKRNDRG